MSGKPGISSIDPVYDQLLESPRLGHDPWTRTDLEIFRPRHVLLWNEISRHLTGPRDTIADIGCHNGFFLRLSAELGFEHFIGVDFFNLPPERSFLSELHDQRTIHANFNSDGFLAEIDDGAVDCLISTEVLEHIYHHPAGYLAECWRVLRTGGLLVLSTPNPCNLPKAVKLLMGRSPTWGDAMFARTPKITGDGEPLAVWDIHFREYPMTVLGDLVGDLPGATVLSEGFIANAPSKRSSRLKNLALNAVDHTGLLHQRLLAATEYMIVRRD